jgi:predicted CXXCH cytochrome family protein
VVILWLAAIPRAAHAGDWHNAQHGVCSDCHSQHGSDLPTPNQKMLKGETVLELCLSCHDGTNSRAPDVIAPVSYVADAAGGFFAERGIPNSPNAHDLGKLPDPAGTLPQVVLSCITCHDPHGNANYRNLRPDPLNTAVPVEVVVTQEKTADGTNPSEVYVPSNLIDKRGISEWCVNCHVDAFSTSHSVNKTMWGSTVSDYSIWSGPIANRVRVDSPTDDLIPSPDDRITCISCHKAHGSSNYRSTVYADGVTLDSTCAECHSE